MGGVATFGKKVKKALICTYHRPNDEIVLKDIMESYGFDCSFNDGYVLYIWDMETFKPPYLRHCVMFCNKTH